MVSKQDFYMIVFETNQLYRLVDLKPNEYMTWYDKSTNDKIEQIIKRIKGIDYDEMNKVLAKIGANVADRKYSDEEKLIRKFKRLSEEYTDTGKIELETEKGYHLIFFSSKEKPSSVNTRDFYTTLLNTTIIRGRKQWDIDEEMVLDIMSTRPELYRQILAINNTKGLYNTNTFLFDMLSTYINQKYPVKFKHRTLEQREETECSESKHGILRGMVHKINFWVDQDPMDLFKTIMNSGYLEIQYTRWDHNSGIFTRLIGMGDKITDFYYGIEDGIHLILSLSALEDFDYWMCPFDVYGRREEDCFYKGFCYECEDSVKEYSAAERGYMALHVDKDEPYENKYAHEMVFASDINLERYLEAIYVPDKKLYAQLMEDKDIAPWIKALVTDKDTTSRVFRKGCLGPVPKPISDNKFDKITKLIRRRKMTKDIPPVNIDSINKKKKLKFLNNDDQALISFPVKSSKDNIE